MVSAPLCACGRPGPFAYGLHAYMAKRSIPDPIEDCVWQNRRIEESQTRQSDLPETPIPSTQSNCTLPEPVKSVESLAESREERAASSDCSGSGPYHRFSLARHRRVSSFIVPSKNDHLVLGKFRFDGRWSIAIAIAIAIKYRISSAAWIGGVSKLVTLSLCVGL